MRALASQGHLQRRALKAELIEFMAREQESDVTLSLLVSSGPFLRVSFQLQLFLAIPTATIATPVGASSVSGSIKCLTDNSITDFSPQSHGTGAVIPILCEENEAQGG